MLSRFYYHVLVAAWLVVLAIVDIVSNTLMDGIMSDVYFYKVFLDLALIGWTAMFLKEDLGGDVVATNSLAASKFASTKGAQEIIHLDLGATEYIYYGFLFFYSFGNLYFHHGINKSSTGLLSLTTLIISIIDIVIAVVAAINFWQVASGKLTRVRKVIEERVAQKK